MMSLNVLDIKAAATIAGLGRDGRCGPGAFVIVIPTGDMDSLDDCVVDVV